MLAMKNRLMPGELYGDVLGWKQKQEENYFVSFLLDFEYSFA